jgi:hypothetical protein
MTWLAPLARKNPLRLASSPLPVIMPDAPNKCAEPTGNGVLCA